MSHVTRMRRNRRRGMTAYVVVLTVAVLAILSHNLVHQALMDYRQGAMVRDTIVLQHLTDSAVARAIYHLNRAESEKAKAPVRESFGVALVETQEAGAGLQIRIAAHAPDETMPRMSSVTRFRLERDAQNRWRVVAAVKEAVPLGESQ